MSGDLALAERSVLGAAMISRSAAEDVTAALKPESFVDWRHADIFAAIVSLVNAGKPCDVIAVTDRLLAQGDLERVGGAALLHQMTSDVPTASNAGYYADIVKEASHKRRLREAVDGAHATLTNDGSAGAYELADHLRGKIETVLDDISGAQHTESIGWDFDDVMASLAEPPDFVKTPWPDLNALIDGWRPGALYVIGARPGGGKSIMGLLAAAGLAGQGPVALCSLEMSQREIMLRLVAARASVLLHALVRHVVQPHQWDAIAQHRSKISDLPIFVDDRGGVTMSEIRAHVRSVKRRGRLAGVVVDYLQLIRADANKPRWEAVGDITRDLKALAREYRVPVIALAQLNRRTEGGVARPGLGDLRESGSIEQDADVVILLNRVLDPNTDELGDELEAIVAKNRSGSTGVATLFWEGQFARISDMSRWR